MIFFPQEVTIPDDNDLECIRGGDQVDCVYMEQLHMLVVTGAFTESPLTAEATLELAVTNIKNPRSLESSSYFNFTTHDSLGNLIDAATENDTIAVTMTDPIPMNDVDIVGLSSLVVGEINTQMTFLVTLSIPFYTGD